MTQLDKEAAYLYAVDLVDRCGLKSAQRIAFIRMCFSDWEYLRPSLQTYWREEAQKQANA